MRTGRLPFLSRRWEAVCHPRGREFPLRLGGDLADIYLGHVELHRPRPVAPAP